MINPPLAATARRDRNRFKTGLAVRGPFATNYEDDVKMSDSGDMDDRQKFEIVRHAILGQDVAAEPIADLAASGGLRAATHHLLNSHDARWYLRQTVPLWPVDKWVCADYAGLKIWINLNDSFVGFGVLAGDWESQEVGYMLRNLLPGDSMIDVGANVGVYALQAARAVGPEGRVYAFEPQTDIYWALDRSIKDNGLSDRCILYNMALGDRDEDVSIWRHHANNPGASIITTGDVSGPGNPTLLKRLDSLQFHRRVKLLKMDIEGYEPLLVAGGQSFLNEHKPIIVTEWFPRAMTEVAGIESAEYFDRLTALGYGVFLLESGTLGQQLTREDVGRFENISEPFNIACVQL